RAHVIRRALAAMPLALGCASTPRPTITPSANACVIGAASLPMESVTVWATGAVDPAHMLQPSNGAERFVSAQAYETLINVDCGGRAYPGLAASWTTDATKTAVTLTLREGAHFWNGDALGANDVTAAWRESAQVGGDAGELARRVADGTTVVDTRTLTVSLPD